MKKIEKLDPMQSMIGRVQRLPASMVKEAIVSVVGESAYFRILEELDKSIAWKKERERSHLRKDSDADFMAEAMSLRTSMLQEMQAQKRYSKTKGGQFIHRFAPYVHEMRTSDPVVPWTTIANFLRGKGFRASIKLLKCCYDDYLQILKKAKSTDSVADQVAVSERPNAEVAESVKRAAGKL